MTLARVVAALGGSRAIGLIINRYEGRFRPDHQLQPVRGGSPLAVACGDCSCEPSPNERRSGPWIELGRNAGRILRSVLPYFLLGMIVAAVLSALVPEDAVPSLLGDAAGGADKTRERLAASRGAGWVKRSWG